MDYSILSATFVILTPYILLYLSALHVQSQRSDILSHYVQVLKVNGRVGLNEQIDIIDCDPSRYLSRIVKLPKLLLPPTLSAQVMSINECLESNKNFTYKITINPANISNLSKDEIVTHARNCLYLFAYLKLLTCCNKTEYNDFKAKWGSDREFPIKYFTSKNNG